VSTTFGVGARLPSAKRRSRRVIEMEQHKTPRTFFCYPQYHDLNIRKVANGLRDLHCVAQHIIKRTVTNSLRLVPTKTCKRPTHQVSEVQDETVKYSCRRSKNTVKLPRAAFAPRWLSLWEYGRRAVSCTMTARLILSLVPLQPPFPFCSLFRRDKLILV
jgi:hypothetical protein